MAATNHYVSVRVRAYMIPAVQCSLEAKGAVPEAIEAQGAREVRETLEAQNYKDIRDTRRTHRKRKQEVEIWVDNSKSTEEDKFVNFLVSADSFRYRLATLKTIHIVIIF